VVFIALHPLHVNGKHFRAGAHIDGDDALAISTNSDLARHCIVVESQSQKVDAPPQSLEKPKEK
jgi:hypothetical protein